MSLRRRSYEPGHSPKFMVVIDDTPECDRALYFASRRALRIGASVLMLRVIEMLATEEDHLPFQESVADGLPALGGERPA